MDGLCLKTGIHGIGSTISSVGGSLDVRSTASQVSAVGRSLVESSSSTAQPSRFSFRYPLRSLWAKGGTSGVKEKRYNGMALDDAVLVKEGEGKRSAVEEGDGDGEGFSSPERRKESWVLKILHVRSLWKADQQRKNDEEGDEETTADHDNDDAVEEEEIDVCRVSDSDNSDDSDADELRFDRESFSKMLRRVSLAEAKLYAQMSYLGNLAYSIPKIKPGNLLKLRGLRFVTSSIEKKESLEKNVVQTENHEKETETETSKGKPVEAEERNASTAYQIAASAASYLHSCSKSILPIRSAKSDYSDSVKSIKMMNSDMASLMATTDSVTAVVAAKEEVKQAVADDLNSTHSSPCEWFICDDDQTSTRFFVIQGSESLASWKANLLFEPIQFEGLDVSVHRGIYEAAKGIYEQMLPEVRSHLKSRGNRANFRFTGHSLGGSLSLLVNLMLLIRGEVPVCALLPVITFGSPAIMCGGDKLLRKLGLPKSHLQAITMHRDIVPRAFSCNYPNHVAELLKAVNGNFRNHSCLNKQKLLYAPMGEFLILQPEEKHSPQHDLLPSGSGLYFMTCPNDDGEKYLEAAKTLFLNCPHPLEILSDRSSYGSEGSIQRDHDMNSYLKSVRGVIRQELTRVRKVKREHQRKVWWAPHAGVVFVGGTRISSSSVNVALPIREKVNFSGVFRSGRESLKRFSRLVASQHMHLFVVLLLPARLLLLGAYSVISLR